MGGFKQYLDQRKRISRIGNEYKTHCANTETEMNHETFSNFVKDSYNQKLTYDDVANISRDVFGQQSMNWRFDDALIQK